MKKIAITLTTFALASSMGVTAAFADSHHGNGHQDNLGFKNHGQMVKSIKVLNQINFKDLGNYGWAKAAIEKLSQQGIIKGLDQNRFNPGGQLTRAEFSALMSRYFGLEADSSDQEDYVDVHSGDWFYAPVEATKDYMTKFTTFNGGYSFMPNKTMNRMDTAVSLVEILVHEGTLEYVSESEADDILSDYSDASQIPTALRVHVATAIKAELMQGVGHNKFNPLGTLNRAQAATLLYNLQTQAEVPPADNGSGDDGSEVPPNGSDSDNDNNGDPTVINVNYDSTVTIGDYITVRSDEDGYVYLVSEDEDTPDSKADLDQLVDDGYAKRVSADANENVRISTFGLDEGDYKVYAVDNDGNLDTASNDYTLENDSDNTAPTVVNVNYDSTVTIGDYITVRSNEDGYVYLVSEDEDTPNSKADLDQLVDDGYAKRATAYANQNVNISTSGLDNGDYKVYAVDNDGNLDTASNDYNLEDEDTAPTVTSVNYDSTVNIGDEITVKSNEDGTVYLISKSVTTPDSKADLDRIVNLGYGEKESVDANENVNISTTGLPEGDYAVYAVDEDGNLSNPSSNYNLR